MAIKFLCHKNLIFFCFHLPLLGNKKIHSVNCQKKTLILKKLISTESQHNSHIKIYQSTPIDSPTWQAKHHVVNENQHSRESSIVTDIMYGNNNKSIEKNKNKKKNLNLIISTTTLFSWIYHHTLQFHWHWAIINSFNGPHLSCSGDLRVSKIRRRRKLCVYIVTYINIKSLTKGISIAAKSHLILYDQSGKIERNKKLRRRSKEKEKKK